MAAQTLAPEEPLQTIVEAGVLVEAGTKADTGSLGNRSTDDSADLEEVPGNPSRDNSADLEEVPEDIESSGSPERPSPERKPDTGSPVLCEAGELGASPPDASPPETDAKAADPAAFFIGTHRLGEAAAAAAPAAVAEEPRAAAADNGGGVGELCEDAMTQEAAVETVDEERTQPEANANEEETPEGKAYREKKETVRAWLEEYQEEEADAKTDEPAPAFFIGDEEEDADGDDGEPSGLPADCPEAALIDLLTSYGFAIDAATGTWRPSVVQPQIKVRVVGHIEERGHKRYTMECELAPTSDEGEVTLRWTTSKRLTHLRRHLHNVVKKQLGEKTYELRFASTPFAHRIALRGTTARLDAWCQTLTTGIQEGVLTPVSAARALLFLDLPCDSQVLIFEGSPQADSVEGAANADWV